MSTSTFTLAVLGLVINGLGLVFIATQVGLARRQIRNVLEQATAKASRLKRQATIDFYMSTLERLANWRIELPDEWDKEAVSAYIDRIYEPNHQEEGRTLASYLGYFETIAMAVRSDIYDLVVLDGIAGSRIVNITNNYRVFFQRRRAEVRASSAYENVEWLGRQITQLRKSRGP